MQERLAKPASFSPPTEQTDEFIINSASVMSGGIAPGEHEDYLLRVFDVCMLNSCRPNPYRRISSLDYQSLCMRHIDVLICGFSNTLHSTLVMILGYLLQVAFLCFGVRGAPYGVVDCSADKQECTCPEGTTYFECTTRAIIGAATEDVKALTSDCQ